MRPNSNPAGAGFVARSAMWEASAAVAPTPLLVKFSHSHGDRSRSGEFRAWVLSP